MFVRLIMGRNRWNWTASLPKFNNIPSPILNASKKDHALSITYKGMLVKYLISRVWNDLCVKDDEVIWKGLVWPAEATWWNASHDDSCTNTYFSLNCDDVAASRS
ncbi:hypothetical protein Tco_0201922 [Tanacetum coccineum]